MEDFWKFGQNWRFLKIWLKLKIFQILVKIEDFWKFGENWRFSKFWSNLKIIQILVKIEDIWKFGKNLTEVAGEGGTDCPPQKFLSSQKFRHLMGWRNMQKKIFLSCLVSEIQLFVYIFGWISKWLPEVRKGSPVKFFEVSNYQNFF